jgi:branched-chain amino acid transport system substrate-binding protein
MKTRVLSIFLVIAIILVGLVTFSAYGQKSAAVRGTKPIKIALHYSTTGWAKSLGIETLHGSLLAVEEINAAGGIYGRPLEPVITDLQSDYTLAVTVAKKMVADKEIVAAVGDEISGTSLAMKPVYFEEHLPAISGSKSGMFTKENMDYAYRFSFNDDWAIPASLKLWKEKFGLKTISLLHTADAWGVYAKDRLTETAPGLGVKILSRNSYAPTAIDVTAQLIRIKAESPDALVMWGYGEPVINAFKGAKTIGLKAQILGPGGILDAAILRALKDEVVGAIVAESMSTDDPGTEPQKKFVKAFRAKYPGDPHTTFSAAAYDAVYIIAEALKKIVKGDELVTREDLKKALDQTDYVGTQGHYKWSPTFHDGPQELYLFTAQIVEGKPKLMRYLK